MKKRKNPPGEWWLLPDGHEEFAGENSMGHSAYAWFYALELDPDDLDYDGPEYTPENPIKKGSHFYKYLLEHGVSEGTLKFFSEKDADAREWAIEAQNWIRVAGNNFEVLRLDDDTLERIQNFSEWTPEDEVGDGTTYVEAVVPIDRQTSWKIPTSKLLSWRGEAAALVRSGRGVSEFRENPLPNEWSVRQKPPAFVVGSKELTEGVRAIFRRIPKSKSSEVQSLRFDKDLFTKRQAKAWAKKHGFKHDLVE